MATDLIFLGLIVLFFVGFHLSGGFGNDDDSNSPRGGL